VLDELERKLTAVVADALAGRAELVIAEAAGLPLAPATGGAVSVGLAALEPMPVFFDDSVQLGDGSLSRRVLPVGFSVTVAFARRAAAEDPAPLADARTALLRDASLVGHALGAPSFASGAAFETASSDPGFEVRAFGLATAELDTVREGPVLRGSLGYAGAAVIWPPGVAQPEGTIGTVARLLEALPLTITTDEAIVPVGSSTTVRIRSISGRRTFSNGDPATPPQLALLVVSDLPPAQRGAIASGTAATEAGVRIVTATDSEVSVAYQAPTGDIGATRSEQISVHLARPDGTVGVFLGATAIALAPDGS
jgi:hypothetical protein